MSESEKVTLCCWPQTRCPEVEILRNKQKVVIRGEDLETREPKGEVELSFQQAQMLSSVLAGL